MWAKHLKNVDRPRESLEVDGTEIAQIEGVAEKRRVPAAITTAPDGATSCSRAARFGVADHGFLAGRAVANKVANDDKASCDTHPRRKRLPKGIWTAV